MSTDAGRRRLIVGGAATIAGAAVVGVVVSRAVDDDQSGPPDDTVGPDAATGVREPPSSPEEAVRLVGAAYLRDEPDEADEAGLRELLPELTAATGAGLIGEFDLLRPRVRTEFETDDVVLIDGWILARSEARGAALVSLAP